MMHLSMMILIRIILLKEIVNKYYMIEWLNADLKQNDFDKPDVHFHF